MDFVNAGILFVKEIERVMGFEMDAEFENHERKVQHIFKMLSNRDPKDFAYMLDLLTQYSNGSLKIIEE